MSTIKDVAEAAGVSVATVSRVLNRTGNVQPATERRVRSAIETLNYSPNLLGRNLRQGETRKILVLLSTFSNQFYSRVVRGIEDTAAGRGYAVMVGATHDVPAVESGYLQMLKTRLVDGVIFLSVIGEGAVLNRELAGFPVVQACEPRGEFLTPRVSIDNVAAGREAAEYLLQMGHREIAYFGAPGGEDLSSAKREIGFRQALFNAGIPLREDWVLHEGFSINAGARAAEHLLAGEQLPTAVFCASDSSAAGAIRRFDQAGLLVPADISVMGFDNTQLSEVYLPPITTTRQPQYQIGKQAMEFLLNRLEEQDQATPMLYLPHEIIERESVARRGVSQDQTDGKPGQLPRSVKKSPNQRKD